MNIPRYESWKSACRAWGWEAFQSTMCWFPNNVGNMHVQVGFMISFEFGKFRKDCNILRYDSEHFRTRKIYKCVQNRLCPPIGTIWNKLFYLKNTLTIIRIQRDAVCYKRSIFKQIKNFSSKWHFFIPKLIYILFG